MTRSARWLLVCTALAGYAQAVPLTTVAPLAGGATRSLSIPPDTGLVVPVTCETAGILTAVTRGTGGDLTLTLRDPDNQDVPDCASDDDYEGVPCNEQLAGTVAYAGVWRVVLVNDGETDSTVTLGLGWLPYPLVAATPRPHSRPSDALAAEVGQRYEGQLDHTQGVRSVWYALTAARTGPLAVGLRTKTGERLDLALRVVTGREFDALVGESDEAPADDTGVERVEFRAVAGQTYFVRVYLGSPGSGRYELETHFGR